MPKVKIILDAYVISFGYEVKSIKNEMHPGKINLLITGNLGKELDEITQLLSDMYPEYTIYQISGSDVEQKRYTYELIISHPDGYSFTDDFMSDEI